MHIAAAATAQPSENEMAERSENPGGYVCPAKLAPFLQLCAQIDF